MCDTAKTVLDLLVSDNLPVTEQQSVTDQQSHASLPATSSATQMQQQQSVTQQQQEQQQQRAAKFAALVNGAAAPVPGGKAIPSLLMLALQRCVFLVFVFICN